MRLTVASQYVTLEQNIPYESDSHRVETPHCLSVAVPDRTQSIVDADMKISSTPIRRAIARGGEELGVQDAWRVKRAVKNARSQVMMSASPIGSGFPNTDNIGDVRRYTEQHSMLHLLRRHNAVDDDVHLGMHDMMVIAVAV